MTTYYLPHLLSIEDYAIMAQRFWRILNAIPEFKEKKRRGDTRHIIRFRKDRLSVILRRKNDIRDRYEIRIDCPGGSDTFFLYDYNTPHEYVVAFCQPVKGYIDESMLKGEVLDFIDDYCTIETVDYRE